MSLYLGHNDYAIFESRDLKHWNKLQDFTLAGDAEALRGDLRAYAEAGVDELIVPFFEVEPLADRLARADALLAALRG